VPVAELERADHAACNGPEEPARELVAVGPTCRHRGLAPPDRRVGELGGAIPQEGLPHDGLVAVSSDHQLCVDVGLVVEAQGDMIGRRFHAPQGVPQLQGLRGQEVEKCPLHLVPGHERDLGGAERRGWGLEARELLSSRVVPHHGTIRQAAAVQCLEARRLDSVDCAVAVALHTSVVKRWLVGSMHSVVVPAMIATAKPTRRSTGALSKTLKFSCGAARLMPFAAAAPPGPAPIIATSSIISAVIISAANEIPDERDRNDTTGRQPVEQ
jgi:hypothetical protein